MCASAPRLPHNCMPTPTADCPSRITALMWTPNMNGTCVAMPQEGTESLAEVVNECIAELKDAGSIETWYGEYQTAAAELGIE